MTQYFILNDKMKQHYKALMSDYLWLLLLVREDFFAIGAVCDETACGYIIVERNDNGYVIHDIFVHPDYRRKGIGTGLIHSLVQIAENYVEDIDCSFFDGEDESFKKFLDSTGLFDFDDDDESKIYKGNISLLYESEQLKKLSGIDPVKTHCVDFYDDCPPAVRKNFIKACREKEYLPVFYVSPGREPENKFCYAVLSEDGTEVQAYMKLNAAEDTLYLESVWCKKGCQKKLMFLFAHIVDLIREDGSYNYLEVCVVEEEVEALLNRLVPNLDIKAKGVSAYWNYKSVEG